MQSPPPCQKKAKEVMVLRSHMPLGTLSSKPKGRLRLTAPHPTQGAARMGPLGCPCSLEEKLSGEGDGPPQHTHRHCQVQSTFSSDPAPALYLILCLVITCEDGPVPPNTALPGAARQGSSAVASIVPAALHPASAPRTGCRRRPLPHPRRGTQKAPNPLILQKGDRLRAGPDLLWVGHDLVHFLHAPLIHSFVQHLESLSGTEAVLGTVHTRMTETWSVQPPQEVH